MSAAPAFTLADLHARLHGPIKDQSYLTDTRLGPTVQLYLAWKRKSRAAARTIDQIERDLARLALAIPPTAFEQVDVTDLILLLDLIPEGSWHRFRSHWNGFFKWGCNRRLRPDNPCDQLPTLQRRNTKPVYPIFSPGEQQALLNGCASSLIPDIDYARVLTLIDTGARKGECLNLQLEDFDLRERVVLLFGKGAKERLVPIRAELVQAIDRLMMENAPVIGRPLRPGDYLFFPWHVSRMSNGERVVNGLYPQRHWSERGFHEWWKRRVTDAGVRYRKPHMTRHTFGTDLVDADANIVDIRDLMGHESTRTTEIYVHSSRKRLHRATDKLAVYRENRED